LLDQHSPAARGGPNETPSIIAAGFAALAALALPAIAATETVLYSFPNSGTGYPSGRRYSPPECIGAVGKRIEGRSDARYISTSYAERNNYPPALQAICAPHNGFLKEDRKPRLRLRDAYDVP
jgi:hypothetical protein